MIARPQLRSLSISELLDESFRLYRNNFLTFVLITALVLVPYKLVSFLQARADESLQSQTPGFGLEMLMGVIGDISATNNDSLFGVVFSLIIQMVLFGVLILTTAQRYQNQPASIGSNVRTALRRLPTLLGALILQALINMLALIPMFVFACFGIRAYPSSVIDNPLNALGSNNGVSDPFYLMVIVLGLLAMLLFIPVFLVAARLQYVTQTILLEESGAAQSIERSWTLTRGSLWRILAYNIIVGLLGICLTTFPAAAIALGMTLLGFDRSFVTTLEYALGSSGEIIVTPFSLIAYTLMFYDLRIRNEGFDLELEQQNLFQPPASSVDYGQSLSS